MIERDKEATNTTPPKGYRRGALRRAWNAGLIDAKAGDELTEEAKEQLDTIEDELLTAMKPTLAPLSEEGRADYVRGLFRFVGITLDRFELLPIIASATMMTLAAVNMVANRHGYDVAEQMLAAVRQRLLRARQEDPAQATA